MVFSARLDQGPLTPEGDERGLAQADPSGQFSLQGLAPGKYRIAMVDPGAPYGLTKAARKVTIREGRRPRNVEIKP